jgi:hypothetical protein
MSKWEEEFIRTHVTTKRLRIQTEQWKKINPEETKRINNILKRFKKIKN